MGQRTVAIVDGSKYRNSSGSKCRNSSMKKFKNSSVAKYREKDKVAFSNKGDRIQHKETGQSIVSGEMPLTNSSNYEGRIQYKFNKGQRTLTKHTHVIVKRRCTVN